jgi:hypothetical protein
MGGEFHLPFGRNVSHCHLTTRYIVTHLARSTLAGVFRSIFLCVSVSQGWFGWGYKTGPGYVEPLVSHMTQA